MSEFGNETATAALRVGEKSIEAILKLIKFMIEARDRETDREYKQAQIKHLNTKNMAYERDVFFSKHSGIVDEKLFYKYCDEPITIKTSLSKKEFEKFEDFAKDYNLAFTAMTDRKVLNEIKAIRTELKEIDKKEKMAKDEGLSPEDLQRKESLLKRKEELESKRENRIITVRGRDLGKVKDITDKMNWEIQLDDDKKEIEVIKSKETLSEGDKKRLTELENEIDSLHNSEFDKFNDVNNEAIVKEAVNEEVLNKYDYNSALASVVNRENAIEPIYVVERTNPNNYMEVTSKREDSPYWEGEQYTSTKFRVFNDNKEQTCEEFSHGQFIHCSHANGGHSTQNGVEHWNNMKAEMKQKGGFTDDLIIFSSYEKYKQYKEGFLQAKEQTVKREDTVSFEGNEDSYKDYIGVINALKGQLDNHRIAINEETGQLHRLGTNQIITWKKDMSDDEKYNYLSGVNISRQINVLKQLNDLQVQKAMVEHQIKMVDSQNLSETDLNNMNNLLNRQSEEIKEKMKKLQAELDDIQKQREEILSAEIINKMKVSSEENENEEDMEDSRESSYIDTDEQYVQSKADWEKDISEASFVETNITPDITVMETERE